MTNKELKCNCGKVYKHRSSLSRHKKTCKIQIDTKNQDLLNKLINTQFSRNNSVTKAGTALIKLKRAQEDVLNAQQDLNNETEISNSFINSLITSREQLENLKLNYK